MPIAILLFAALALLAPAAHAAGPAAAATANGKFRSQDAMMDVRSAIAFRGKSARDGSDALIVAVSNAQLNPDTIADYIDRMRVVETRIKDRETGIVYFEFRPDGTFRGVSYAFGPGNDCATCAGAVVSSVKLLDGKLAGKLAVDHKERGFDVELFVPVMSDDHGEALPADGGAPGKAWRAYHEALARGERSALKPLLSKDQQQYWDDLEKKGQLGPWIQAMAQGHPTKAATIVQGYATGNKAVLAVAGDAASGKVAGDVLLLKEGGEWRIDDEITARVRP